MQTHAIYTPLSSLTLSAIQDTPIHMIVYVHTSDDRQCNISTYHQHNHNAITRSLCGRQVPFKRLVYLLTLTESITVHEARHHAQTPSLPLVAMCRTASTVSSSRVQLMQKDDDVVITFARRTMMGGVMKGRLKDVVVDRLLHALFTVLVIVLLPSVEPHSGFRQL
ncbi:hypothetical protein EDB92DRAFT_995153 [Lactarius akahatsu]|uniref:Uncharacterized protein n=1 Tax=Lactarius akahatsu TaxID=416441 RepID=A0AAD4LET7_9AGAM|nr:hypothetical protein EDB92DRAFT_995153 [Lactarius akahatsu]